MIRLVINKRRIGFVLLNCSIWFGDFALIAIGETEARAYRRPPNSSNIHAPLDCVRFC
jgi:hypothetical protein